MSDPIQTTAVWVPRRPSPFQHAISMTQEVHGGLQTAREWDIASTAARAAYEAAYREMAELFMERAKNVV